MNHRYPFSAIHPSDHYGKCVGVYFNLHYKVFSSPLSQEDAQALWNQKTCNGTQKCKFEDRDYYAIFPADTVMLFSSQAIANEQK